MLSTSLHTSNMYNTEHHCATQVYRATMREWWLGSNSGDQHTTNTNNDFGMFYQAMARLTYPCQMNEEKLRKGSNLRVNLTLLMLTSWQKTISMREDKLMQHWLMQSLLCTDVSLNLKAEQKSRFRWFGYVQRKDSDRENIGKIMLKLLQQAKGREEIRKKGTDIELWKIWQDWH